MSRPLIVRGLVQPSNLERQAQHEGAGGRARARRVPAPPRASSGAPPLPYKVDTSRPSLRTKRTRPRQAHTLLLLSDATSDGNAIAKKIPMHCTRSNGLREHHIIVSCRKPSDSATPRRYTFSVSDIRALVQVASLASLVYSNYGNNATRRGIKTPRREVETRWEAKWWHWLLPTQRGSGRHFFAYEVANLCGSR